jgi:hypothetical protein
MRPSLRLSLNLNLNLNLSLGWLSLIPTLSPQFWP